MKLLSWNCRELRNPRTIHDLMVKDKKSSILFLMENKIYKTKMGKLKHLLDFQGLFTVDRFGRGGGLALLWKVDIPLEIHSFSQRHKLLHCKHHPKTSMDAHLLLWTSCH